MNKHPVLKRLGSIILFLPLLAMLMYIVFIANDEISIENVLAVRISDDKYEHCYKGKEDIEEYVSFVLEATEGAVQQVNSEDSYYKIEFELKDNISKTYYFYPSLSGKSVLVDGKGYVYKVENVDNILMRREYEALYYQRWLPNVEALSVEGSVSIAPSEYMWSFKKSDNGFYNYTNTSLADTTPALSISASAMGKGVVSFSVTPDELVVAYTAKNKTVSDPAELNLSHGEAFSILAAARWTKKDNCDFYGEGKWNIDCVFNDSPLITLDKTDVGAGECLVIYVENIEPGEVLTLETELETYKFPVVYGGKNRNFALLPVGIETISGDYPLKITANDEVFAFDISVTTKNVGFYRKNLSAELYNYVISPDGIEEYQSFIKENLEKTNNDFYWKSPVLSPPINAEIGTDFGAEILYNGLPPSLYYDGISYKAEEKTEIYSAADGKVIFVGENKKSGVTAIVDHGCGIMTHYYHLSVVSVYATDSVGADIKEGGIIGYSGKTGFTDVADVHFAVSINGVFVNPHLFLEESK